MQIKFLPLSKQWVNMTHLDYEQHPVKGSIYQIAVYNEGKAIIANISVGYFHQYSSNTKENCLNTCIVFNEMYRTIESSNEFWEPFPVAIIR